MPFSLVHYGILGQQWGVRRFQNLDGTLTPEGKERYSGLVGEAGKNKEARYKNLGIVKNQDGSYTIKKGSKFSRIADAGESLDSRRKYVSIVPADLDTYKGIANELGVKDPKNAKVYTYIAKRDIQIASGHAVAEHVLGRIGQSSMVDFYDKYNETLDVYTEIANRIKSGKLSPDMADFGYASEMMQNYPSFSSSVNRLFLQKVFNKTLYKGKVLKDHGRKYRMTDELESEFIRKGKDGIVDIEDKLAQIDLPLVLYNPEKILKLDKVESIN